MAAVACAEPVNIPSHCCIDMVIAVLGEGIIIPGPQALLVHMGTPEKGMPAPADLRLHVSQVETLTK